MAAERTAMMPDGVVAFFDINKDSMLPSGIVVSVTDIAAAISATLTGTITASVVESDIVTGGKTIILTLTGDTWVAAGAAFNAQRQNIINGIDSAQAEATGWDAEVKAKESKEEKSK